MGVYSLPKTVNRQRRDCDLNPGPSAPESSTLTTRATQPPHIIKSNVKGYSLCVHATLGGWATEVKDDEEKSGVGGSSYVNTNLTVTRTADIHPGLFLTRLICFDMSECPVCEHCERCACYHRHSEV